MVTTRLQGVYLLREMEVRHVRWKLSAATALAWSLAGLSGWAAAAWGYQYTDNTVGNPNYNVYCNRGAVDYLESRVCRTDNKTLRYFSTSSGTYALEASNQTDVTWVMENRLEITNLDVSIQSPPAYTGSAETDVIVEEGPVLTGYDGWTWCDDPIVEYFCDQAYIRIRGGDKFKRPIICHEAGHSVGLTHGNDGSPWRDPDSQEPGLGCLRNPVPNVDWGPYATGNINAMYP